MCSVLHCYIHWSQLKSLEVPALMFSHVIPRSIPVLQRGFIHFSLIYMQLHDSWIGFFIAAAFTFCSLHSDWKMSGIAVQLNSYLSNCPNWNDRWLAIHRPVHHHLQEGIVLYYVKILPAATSLNNHKHCGSQNIDSFSWDGRYPLYQNILGVKKEQPRTKKV